MRLPYGFVPLVGFVAALACSQPASSSESSALVLAKMARDPRVSSVRRATAPTGDRPLSCSRFKLDYYGGPVIENVKVYQVSWGADVNDRVRAGLPAFYSFVVKSPYFDWLSEYNTAGLSGRDGLPGSNQGIGRGSFGGDFVIAPSTTSTFLTDDDIQRELLAQIRLGALPPPDAAADGTLNAVYMLDFPPGVTIKLGAATSCAQFCAYHNTATWNGAPFGYSVHPDFSPGSPCTGGCGTSDDYFDNVTAAHSHELVEMVTDVAVGLAVGGARPLAWYDAAPVQCGEIGDLCNGDQVRVSGYALQYQWSNARGACIVSNPALPPVCTGNAGTPAGCRPCTVADEGGLCAGATPHCETDPGSPKYGACVACASDAACGGTTPICDKSGTAAADTCRACTPADCSGAAPVCATEGALAGHCVECAPGATTACTGATPDCDAREGRCVPCTSNASCASSTGMCNLATHRCVECLTAADCTATDACRVAACSEQGACIDANAPDDIPCDDGNACTRLDRCKSGACSGEDPVVCGGSGTCGGVGTCNPHTGACTEQFAPNGTPCGDENKCLVDPLCKDGVCSGRRVDCPAIDECHLAGACEPSTGVCSTPAKRDGTPCANGLCFAGICGGPGGPAGDAMAGDAGDDAKSGGAHVPSLNLGGDAGGAVGAMAGSAAEGAGCSARAGARGPADVPIALGAIVALRAVRLRRKRA